MLYHRLYQVSSVWIVLVHLHMDWIAVRRLRPYAHRLGRAQPPRTSAPRGGAVQVLQPRQLHRDHWVGAAMVANVCSIFAVCVWISTFATSCPLLVLLPLSTVTMERGSRNLVTAATPASLRGNSRLTHANGRRVVWSVTRDLPSIESCACASAVDGMLTLRASNWSFLFADVR